jgi:ECF sigma factor
LEVDEAVPEDVTGLLRAWSDGDADALAALTPLVYRELHRRAHWHMAREADGHVLQTTTLVNEIYIRMVDCGTCPGATAPTSLRSLRA